MAERPRESRRDAYAPVGYSNPMIGGVGLYCDVLVAAGFTCCQVTHDCRYGKARWKARGRLIRHNCTFFAISYG